MEVTWKEDSGEQDCVITKPCREMPRLFNTTVEVSVHIGKKLAFQMPTLIDTRQNNKERILPSRDFCAKLGLISELIMNFGILMNCTNPCCKIQVLGRLKKGVCRLT